MKDQGQIDFLSMEFQEDLKVAYYYPNQRENIEKNYTFSLHFSQKGLNSGKKMTKKRILQLG